MKTIRKTFRVKVQFDVNTINEPGKFNQWIMCPRTVINFSTDGYHVQVNRLPLTVYQKTAYGK